MTTEGSSHRDRYALASEIGTVVTSSLVLEEVLAVVARRIGEALGVWECDIFEYDPQANVNRCLAEWIREPIPGETSFVGQCNDLAEQPGTRHVMETREMAETHIDDEWVSPQERALMARWREKSVLEAPLVFNDEVIGLLALIEKRSVRQFTKEDRELLASLSVTAAIAIHNARMYRRQEEQNRRLASLLDSTRAITSTVVLEEVLSLVARKAAAALASPECIIYEYDPEADAIVFRSSWDQEPPAEAYDPPGTSYPLAEYPGDRAILQAGRVVAETISDPNLDAVNRRSMQRWGDKTILNVPLHFGSDIVGLLTLVETEHEREFTSEEIELARGLGEQAAVAIKNAQLYRREQQRSERLVGLLAASRAMTASLDLAHVLERVRAEIDGILGGRQSMVDVRLRRPDDLYVPFQRAMAGDVLPLPGDEVWRTDNLAQQAIASLGPVQSDARSRVPRLVVPLVLKDEAIGYVDVRGGERKGFGEDEVELVQILANQAAVAVENARLYQTIEQQATTDGLTGLHNHRYFYDRLGEEIAKARRYNAPLSLLMLDLDDFKAYNDEYGHPAGDQVLREVGDLVVQQLRRKIDLAFRYGGEEFAVLLPNTSGRTSRKPLGPADDQLSILGNEAASAAERIRLAVRETAFAGHGGGRTVRLTVSVGVATFPYQAHDEATLVGRADEALYLAKRLGKDRVELYG